MTVTVPVPVPDGGGGGDVALPIGGGGGGVVPDAVTVAVTGMRNMFDPLGPLSVM